MGNNDSSLNTYIPLNLLVCYNEYGEEEYIITFKLYQGFYFA